MGDICKNSMFAQRRIDELAEEIQRREICGKKEDEVPQPPSLARQMTSKVASSSSQKSTEQVPNSSKKNRKQHAEKRVNSDATKTGKDCGKSSETAVSSESFARVVTKTAESSDGWTTKTKKEVVKKPPVRPDSRKLHSGLNILESNDLGMSDDLKNLYMFVIKPLLDGPVPHIVVRCSQLDKFIMRFPVKILETLVNKFDSYLLSGAKFDPTDREIWTDPYFESGRCGGMSMFLVAYPKGKVFLGFKYPRQDIEVHVPADRLIPLMRGYVKDAKKRKLKLDDLYKASFGKIHLNVETNVSKPAGPPPTVNQKIEKAWAGRKPRRPTPRTSR